MSKKSGKASSSSGDGGTAKLTAWAARQQELAKKNQEYMAMLLEAGVPDMTFRPKDWRNEISCKFYPDCKCGDACPYKHDPAVLDSVRRARLEAQRQAMCSVAAVVAPRRTFTEDAPSVAPPTHGSRRTFTEETSASSHLTAPGRPAKRTFSELSREASPPSPPPLRPRPSSAPPAAPSVPPPPPPTPANGCTVPCVADLD